MKLRCVRHDVVRNSDNLPVWILGKKRGGHPEEKRGSAHGSPPGLQQAGTGNGVVHESHSFLELFAKAGAVPNSLLRPERLRSPCAPEIPILQLPQRRQHRRVHAAARFVWWGQERQAVRLSCPKRHPVTRGRVGIQTCKAPRQQPDPCSGVRGTNSTTQKEKFGTGWAG